MLVVFSIPVTSELLSYVIMFTLTSSSYIYNNHGKLTLSPDDHAHEAVFGLLPTTALKSPPRRRPRSPIQPHEGVWACDIGQAIRERTCHGYSVGCRRPRPPSVYPEGLGVVHAFCRRRSRPFQGRCPRRKRQHMVNTTGRWGGCLENTVYLGVAASSA